MDVACDGMGLWPERRVSSNLTDVASAGPHPQVRRAMLAMLVLIAATIGLQRTSSITTQLILFSSAVHRGDAAKYLGMGFASVLTKPLVRPSLLLDAIVSVVGGGSGADRRCSAARAARAICAG